VRLACLALVFSSACTSPCEPEGLLSAPGGGPLRYAVAFGAGAAMNGGGVGATCVACDEVFQLDSALAVRRRITVDFNGIPTVAVAGDTTVVFANDGGQEEDPGDDTIVERPPHSELFAVDASGKELWRNDLGTGEQFTRGFRRNVVAGAHTVVAIGGRRAEVYDAMTGAFRFATLARSEKAIAVDADGGVFVATGGSLFDATNDVTLRRYDASGVETWTRTWVAHTQTGQTAHASIAAAATTTDGGFVVLGEFQGAMLNTGDRDVPGGDPRYTLFVASLDGDGATRWVVPFGAIDNASLEDIAASGDAVLIGGTYHGNGNSLGLPQTPFEDDESFVSRIEPDGTVTTHVIGGPGYQAVDALVAGDDGSAIVNIFVAKADADRIVVQVGDTALDAEDQASLVLAIEI
jgi:hypothetical protein